MPGKKLWSVKIDPSQIDQILANLCVNAGDAITGVGKLTIETENITFDEYYCSYHQECVPGDYVMLAVGDTGCGMNPETLDKLFEPFFTTKEIGKG
ncbi:MAG: hybrid sensor histidine kinase/response regulator, partial [Desulfamplus sp.]|nr:hybrid sensor histidine kinase/response regulator [Desulfamplus sp.]